MISPKRISAFILLTIVGTLVTLMIMNNSSQSVLLRKKIQVQHETYAPGEDNYEFCTQLCVKKGGVNCGGKRLGCCVSSMCTVNKIYKYNECQTGGSIVMGTTRCIGTWGGQ